MNEEFLHYVWKYQLFSFHDLKTTIEEDLTILKVGSHNHNSGPDFLNSKIEINNQLWFGNIEIHVKSSDWYVHHHEIDHNYDAVILHVVWEDDATIFMKDNKPLPVLVLKDFVFKSALNNYQKAIESYIEVHKVHPYMKSPLIMIEKLQLQIKKESI